MNHWVLVGQDIWSVAKFGLPFAIFVIGLIVSDMSTNDPHIAIFFIIGWILVILNWMCIAGAA